MKEEEGICMGSEEKFESGVRKLTVRHLRA